MYVYRVMVEARAFSEWVDPRLTLGLTCFDAAFAKATPEARGAHKRSLRQHESHINTALQPQALTP